MGRPLIEVLFEDDGMSKQPPKQSSGGRRQKDAGRTHIAVWLDAADLAAIDAARGKLHRTQFLTIHGLEAAKKILKKNS